MPRVGAAKNGRVLPTGVIALRYWLCCNKRVLGAVGCACVWAERASFVWAVQNFLTKLIGWVQRNAFMSWILGIAVFVEVARTSSYPWSSFALLLKSLSHISLVLFLNLQTNQGLLVTLRKRCFLISNVVWSARRFFATCRTWLSQTGTPIWDLFLLSL